MENNNLLNIRRDIERCINRRVILKANKGRKKTVIKEGVLESAYPSLFVVKVKGDQGGDTRRVSYTYSDILTGTVEVTVRQEKANIL